MHIFYSLVGTCYVGWRSHLSYGVLSYNQTPYQSNVNLES